MSGFEWVTYDEDASPAPVYGPEPPDESFDDAEFEVALGGYSDGRKEEAERRRVDAVMAEAKREGAKLQEFLKNPQAMRDHDARLAADAAEAAAVAHGTTSDGDSSDDDLVEPPKTAPTAEDTARVDALIHQAEVLKRSGNERFLTCCAATDDARRRDLAADAAIFYLDVLDVLHTAEQVPATPDQAGALRDLTLATLLNRAAALNKQDEWRLSLRATNRALKLDAANVKGLYRRAVALAGLAPFAYAHAGSLCCLGSGHAIAQLAAPRAPAFYAWRGLHAAGKDGDERAVVGGPAFVLWRSLYFSQLLSAKTCFSVSSDWLKTLTSGRDAGAVEPIQRRATDAGLS